MAAAELESYCVLMLSSGSGGGVWPGAALAASCYYNLCQARGIEPAAIVPAGSRDLCRMSSQCGLSVKLARFNVLDQGTEVDRLELHQTRPDREPTLIILYQYNIYIIHVVQKS